VGEGEGAGVGGDSRRINLKRRFRGSRSKRGGGGEGAGVGGEMEIAEGYNLKRRFKGSRSKSGGGGGYFGRAHILRIAVLQRGPT
jgi:hypothetical protein